MNDYSNSLPFWVSTWLNSIEAPKLFNIFLTIPLVPPNIYLYLDNYHLLKPINQPSICLLGYSIIKFDSIIIVPSTCSTTIYFGSVPGYSGFEGNAVADSATKLVVE
jgi:hypothetical protein